MPGTERLYYHDSHLIEFEARVVDTSERVSGWTAVTLDRTAFYPTGGGQPSDTGVLNGIRVVECIDDEDNGVLHVIQGRAPEIGSTVKGRVDWARRLDHMQQHTGQHILSQAFVTLFNAPTRSFRVLEDSCEIDVDLANPTTEVIERAVELANNVIWEDRTITIKSVSSDEAAKLPLRKAPARDGELRVIEIEGFDLTPCGGTHAYRTGEVGMIAVRHWERARGLTRIEFVAGMRALADYRRANKTARAVAALYSSARDDAAKLTTRVLDENKELHRRIRALEEIAARVEAEELLSSVHPGGVRDSSRGSSAQRDTPGSHAHQTIDPEGVTDGVARDDARGSSPTPGSPAGQPGWGGTVRKGVGDGSPTIDESATDQSRLRVITRVFDNRDAESLKHLAQALIAHPLTIALLGSREKDAARLVFARSADAPGDMSALMREACALLNGRGGGKPDMAQGGGQNVGLVNEALELAMRRLE